MSALPAGRPARDRSSRGGPSEPLPDGTTKKQSHEARQLNKHREVVEQCEAQAREDGESVTSHIVLKATTNPGCVFIWPCGSRARR